MKYAVKPTAKFQRDLKKVQKRGYDISLLTVIIKNWPTGSNYLRKIEIIARVESI